MYTRRFWLDTAERCVRTAAQVAAGVIGTTAVIQEVDWGIVAGTTATATLLSLLMALAAGASSSGNDDASFQEAV